MADIKINGITPTAIYVGNTPASAVYYGNTKVWDSTPPDPHSVVIGGKRYPTATMPDGKEWMALNLDYAWDGLTVCTSSVIKSTSVAYAAYYDRNETTYGWNGLKYGLLYNWKAANYLNANRSTLCPGWHVPSYTELQNLVTAVGNNSYTLRGNDGWANTGGTNIYGFTMQPSGYWDQSSSAFSELTYQSSLYANNQYSSSMGYRLYIASISTKVFTEQIDKKSFHSIRLVKD